MDGCNLPMITANYSDHQTPQFRVLSEAQCQEIYLATLECLYRIGVQVKNSHARDLLGEAGAIIDGERVYIPTSIIQDALAVTPPAFTLWGRDGKRSIHVAPRPGSLWPRTHLYQFHRS